TNRAPRKRRGITPILFRHDSDCMSCARHLLCIIADSSRGLRSGARPSSAARAPVAAAGEMLSVIYSIWHVPSGNLMTTCKSKREVLDLIRDGVAEHGPA